MLEQVVDRYIYRSPIVATSLYFGVLFALLFATWSALSDLYDRDAALAAATAFTDQLEARRPNDTARRSDSDAARAGSPLLEGPTVTVAGAGLLQRVAAAVTQVGGTELSSQVDLQGTQSKEGYVSVIVNCELEQSALQNLLYDLESGMPYLFVDQLVVQALSSPNSAPSGRLRVLLAVSGQWQAAQRP
jgi:general secretion pathway protein M